MGLTNLRLVAECGDNARWNADDEHGNVVVCGYRNVRFPAGSLSPREEEGPDDWVSVVIENHLLAIDDDDGPRLSLPGGRRVRLPEKAARGLYGSAYDRSMQRLYLLTADSLLEVSLRSLEVTETHFGGPPDLPHAYYERVIAGAGCVAAHSYGLWFRSPRGTFQQDEPSYCAAAIEEAGYARRLTGDRRTVRRGKCGAEPYAVIPQAHGIVFGTMQGNLILWDMRTHGVETIELPDAEERRNRRIVSLLWCEPRQLLFIGTRDGGIYTARVEPRGPSGP